MNVARPYRPHRVSPYVGWAPSWSPDSRRILFTSWDDHGFTDLFTMRADGTGVVNVTRTPDVFEDLADWSLDGSSLAYYAEGSTVTGIYVSAADGTGRRIVALTFSPVSPSWSPAGGRIAFIGDDGYVSLVDYIGGSPRRVPGTANARQVDWQPHLVG